ncbi:MAG: cation transporter [Gemmatimonadota bacterium]|nr:cation transporter [Gemmatimonadota bacterium]
MLRALLVINAAMFVVEAVGGWLGESTGLLGDSIDMLADAGVYAISLYAVGRSERAKSGAALGSGIFQMALAGFVLAEVVRRALVGSEPVSVLMMTVGGLALAANVTCLKLISRYRKGEVHMRASWVFSRNDVLVNLGVIAGGGLVALTGSRIPDLVIGAFVSLAVFRGGVRIVRDATSERRSHARGG